MTSLPQLIKMSKLFRTLSDAEIEEKIMPHAMLQEVPKGKFLINYQERVDYFGIVISGKINIMHIYGNGNYGIMDILEQSDTLGVDLVCTRSRISPYYAVAVVPSQALFFPASIIFSQGVLDEQTRMAVLNNVLRFIADENMRKEYRLAILFQKGIRDRILTFLTMQASKRKSNTFSIPFTRDEMASYLCVNRTCLSHELSLMEQEGIIKFNRNHFALLNWEQKNTEF